MHRPHNKFNFPILMFRGTTLPILHPKIYSQRHPSGDGILIKMQLSNNKRRKFHVKICMNQVNYSVRPINRRRWKHDFIIRITHVIRSVKMLRFVCMCVCYRKFNENSHQHKDKLLKLESLLRNSTQHDKRRRRRRRWHSYTTEDDVYANFPNQSIRCYT